MSVIVEGAKRMETPYDPGARALVRKIPQSTPRSAPIRSKYLPDVFFRFPAQAQRRVLVGAAPPVEFSGGRLRAPFCANGEMRFACTDSGPGRHRSNPGPCI